MVTATRTKRKRRDRQQERHKTATADPRTITGACVRIPSGDRAYVEGINPKDSERVLVKYETLKFYGQDPLDSYPLHLLTLVHPSLEAAQELTAGSIELLEHVQNPSSTTFAEAYEAECREIAEVEAAIAPDPLDELADQLDNLLNPSALDTLATEINALYGQLEEAEEVATSAAKSALIFAREMGEKLLQAKKQVGHGKWEEWRNQLISPRSGKAMPSSTAALYQRIASRWQEVEQAETLREAAGLLKSDRQLPSKSKSATVAETSPPSLSPQFPPPKLPPDFADQSDEEAGLIAHPTPNTQHLPTCKPSITPEDFNREIAVPQFIGCHNCKYQVLTGSGDRYWCDQGEFDDTLLLKQNWMEMNEGCKSFTQPVPGLKPTYPVPQGVLRLEDVEAGKELHGLVLSEERFFKLAALARSLDGSMATALFSLIDQLPEVNS